MKSATRAIWIVALAVGVLWPSRALSALDGVPLTKPLEAVLLGLVLPALVLLSPEAVERRLVKAAIVTLLSLKAAALATPQHGLCARFSTTPPFGGVISTIEISEPAGMLRSWDVRADWRSASPRCTAIFDRPYPSREQFPIWFVNLLNALRPGGDTSVDIDGYLNVTAPGTISIEAGRDLALAGTVDGVALSASATALSAQLPAGSHRLQLHGSSRGSDWRFVPRWNGQDAYAAAQLTASPGGTADRWLARPLSILIPAAVVVVLMSFLVAGLTNPRLQGMAVVFGALASLAVAAVVLTGRFERFAPLVLLGAPFVPLRHRHRSMRIAFLMVGLPWLTLFVVQSLPRLTAITEYSLGDDWQMFQAAGYSIVLNGQWMRGGSGVFLFQPLYRYLTGALHVVFGDPSVGELYADAASLLASALASFALVKPVSGFRAAIAAAALTLATFTIGPIWYLIGRGLSEIAAAGFMSVAVIFLLRARLGRVRAAVAGGIFAVLMFLTRLNHLLLAGFMIAALLPLRTPARLSGVIAAIRRVSMRSAAVYSAIVIAGTLLYCTRTWWYSGHFSVSYGTSYAIQRTGLSPLTIASPAAWSNVGEALAGQLTMNEPPAPDARASLLVIGTLLSMLALLQLPVLNRLPAALALLTFGTIVGSFIVHTHEYAGRMSVHVVPFAVAVAVCAAFSMVRGDRSVSFPAAVGR